MPFTCPKNHRRSFQCHSGPPDACTQCAEDTKLSERRQNAAFAAQQKREREQRLHDQRMAHVDAQITKQNEALRDAQLAEDRQKAFEQRQKDLEAAVSSALVPQQPKPDSSSTGAVPTTSSKIELVVSSSLAQSEPVTAPPPAQPVTSSLKPQPGSSSYRPAPNKSPAHPIQPPASVAEAQWKRQKEVFGAKNDAIDDIMAMGGLEKVKQKVLDIKDQVDVASSQGTSLKKKRFNASMLGNPGTGGSYAYLLRPITHLFTRKNYSGKFEECS
jgi:hypothetical protein